jgi:hypothetical protein
MNPEIWSVGIIGAAAAVILAAVYKRWATHQALNKLYEVQRNGSAEQFMDALDSDMARFYFRDFTRKMMKLNYWINRNDPARIRQVIEEFRSVKMSDQEKIQLFSRMFGYYVENGCEEKARPIYLRLQKLLKAQKGRQAKALQGEIQQVAAVYLEHDASYIPILQEYANSSSNSGQKTVYLYRLAKLYDYHHQRDAALQCLKQAVQVAQEENEKKKLTYLSEHLDELNP